MNNSVFGKTIENLKNRTDMKIVRDWETDKIRKQVSSPSFDRFTIFGNDMAGIHMHKTKLVLNKPVYTGTTILENSKILMYDFFYNYLGESEIRGKMRPDLHGYRQPALKHPDTRCVQRHEGRLMAV